VYRFLLSHAIGLVIVLLSVSFLTFIIGYFAPGDPIRVMMGIKSVAYPDAYMQLKHAYGLDLPWWQQYYNADRRWRTRLPGHPGNDNSFQHSGGRL
jgi:ABC-type dipeptide/oligopeptide/nickel transport system permease component